MRMITDTDQEKINEILEDILEEEQINYLESVVLENSMLQKCNHKHKLINHIFYNVKAKITKQEEINDWTIFKAEINLDEFIENYPKMKPYIKYSVVCDMPAKEPEPRILQLARKRKSNEKNNITGIL